MKNDDLMLTYSNFILTNCMLQNPTITAALKHFRPDVDYMVKVNSVCGEGVNGAVHDVEIFDHVKKKHFTAEDVHFVKKQVSCV